MVYLFNSPPDPKVVFLDLFSLKLTREYYNFAGVKGLVLDIDMAPVPGAILVIKGREVVKFRSTSKGEFWRLLMPGTYEIEVGLILVKY